MQQKCTSLNRMRAYIILLQHFTFNKILCCWYSFESSHRDDSNEYQQHMIFLTLEYLFQAKFLLFPQCFLPILRTFCCFHQIWNCRLQTLSVSKSLKLSNKLRGHQKVVTEEKWSLNATKVHLTKQNESIYYTFTTLYFQQNPMLLVLIWIVSSRRFKWVPTTYDFLDTRVSISSHKCLRFCFD